MATIDDLVDYYANLLIKQYHGLTKAKATIEEVSRETLSDLVWFAVRDGFDINTAVGVQLDIVGKYVGASRNQQGTAPLGDDEFRIVIKTKIAKNSCDQTYAAIDNYIWFFFKDPLQNKPRIWLIDNLDMTMTYYCSLFDKDTMDYAQKYDLLPRPAGVAIIIEAILNPNGEFGYSMGGSANALINGYGFEAGSVVGGTMLFIGG
jgi:phage gp36-like protein